MLKLEMSQCKNCGSSEVVSSHGELVCNDCGAVVETSVIVSEVQFQENANGFSTVVGQFVSYEGGRGMSGTSRQMTIRNARERIQTIAHQLNMQQHVEMAVKFFKLANSKHLTKGRNSVQVAAACLYIVCRILSKPIMLLDFSDKVKVDVYKLGRIYRYFAKELHIEIPILDPCLYIERYAQRLEFGDKTMEVCKTANRLVSSMSRDWMVEGRRPSGICGAALLVAARIFNFNRTIKDVIKVVRIGERTIKNRLKEFEQTESSKLTIDEFHTMDLEQAMDPPSFTAGLKKAKVAELKEKDLPLLLEEMEQLKNELEEGIQEMIDRQMKRHKRSLDDTDHTEEDLSLSSVAPTMEALEEELAQYQDLLNDTTFQMDFSSSKENDCRAEDAELVSNSFPNSPSCVVEDDPDIDRLESTELEDILNQNMGSTENCTIIKTMSSLALKDSIKECLSQEINGDEMNGELDLEGIDDAELDELILKEDEVKIKTLGWMRENADFLKESREKELRKARELLLNPKVNKVNRKPRQARPRMEFNSAQEALKQILKEKNLKDKVNYDILANFGLSPTKRKFEPCIEIQVADENRSTERCQSPAEKKARIDLPQDLSGVQKQEAESDDEQYYYDKDEQENQPNQQQEFEYEEPCEEFDNYYSDSD